MDPWIWSEEKQWRKKWENDEERKRISALWGNKLREELEKMKLNYLRAWIESLKGLEVRRNKQCNWESNEGNKCLCVRWGFFFFFWICVIIFHLFSHRNCTFRTSNIAKSIIRLTLKNGHQNSTELCLVIIIIIFWCDMGHFFNRKPWVGFFLEGGEWDGLFFIF